ncbi:DUF998 domain-containing protein [Lysobacter xanthus]
MQRPVSLPRLAVVAAAMLFAAALAGFGAAFPVFSNLLHPVALLGASGMPRAVAFNAIAFVLPGLLVAVALQARRRWLHDAPLMAGVGLNACTLSALAFVGMGLSPLDSGDLLGASGRLHGALWTLWWIAFAAGAALLRLGVRGPRDTRMATLVAIGALHVLLFALLLPGLLPVGLSQRLAFAAWFVATFGLAPPSRSAVSSPGSSPKAPA